MSGRGQLCCHKALPKGSQNVDGSASGSDFFYILSLSVIRAKRLEQKRK